MLSPSLRDFLKHHPEAVSLLSAKYAEETRNREISILYVYTDEKSAPSAFHEGLNPTQAFVVLRANQQPLDELIGLVYELYNSERDEDFQIICSEAVAGGISRDLFPVVVLREEFRAYPKTRRFLEALKLSSKEKARSREYREFMNCPNEFEDFRAHCWGTNYAQSAGYRQYQTEYDALREGKNARIFP